MKRSEKQRISPKNHKKHSHFILTGQDVKEDDPRDRFCFSSFWRRDKNAAGDVVFSAIRFRRINALVNFTCAATFRTSKFIHSVKHEDIRHWLCGWCNWMEGFRERVVQSVCWPTQKQSMISCFRKQHYLHGLTVHIQGCSGNKLKKSEEREIENIYKKNLFFFSGIYIFWRREV